jgi:DNA-directed RNA polymerase subunit E'/Rpb7
MFFLSSITSEICILPKDLTTDTRTLIECKAKELVGKVIGNNGYIISIIDFSQLSKGKVDNETGRVNFKIIYKAITFKLIEHEIIDTKPFFINEYGFFCKIGPCQLFISKHMMTNWDYNSDKNIWFNFNDVVCIDKSIKLKIIAVRINSSEITGLASIYT